MTAPPRSQSLTPLPPSPPVIALAAGPKKEKCGRSWVPLYLGAGRATHCPDMGWARWTDGLDGGGRVGDLLHVATRPSMHAGLELGMSRSLVLSTCEKETCRWTGEPNGSPVRTAASDGDSDN